MKYLIKQILRFSTIFLIVVIYSCEEKENGPVPIVETQDVGGIYQRTAYAGGNVISDKGSPILSRGICWNTDTLPTTNNNHTAESGSLGIFTSTLNGLVPGTIYHVRAYATNKFGTGYGDDVSFEAGPIRSPDVGTVQVSSVTNNSAIAGGVIGYNGGDSVTAKGVCWSTSSDPTIADFITVDGGGNDDYVSVLTGLSGNTTYYYKAYATNSAGISYGTELSFKTITDSTASVLFSPVVFNEDLTYGTGTDQDHNEYKIIQIGTQTWMAENLKVITFISGNQIANLHDCTIWPDYTLDAFNWYNYDIDFKINYGALYNWYAVNTDLLCPSGWHVPSKDEFEILITYLGGENVAGGKLRETGADHWLSPNEEADNMSGFTALPAGWINSGEFESLRTGSYFWSSTESSSDEIYYLAVLGNINAALIDSTAKTNGLSVRCIKD